MQELLFQFHVTTSVLLETQKEVYVSICRKCNLKPVFILLPKGQYMQQPMFTALIQSENFSKAYHEIEEILKEFSRFPPIRIKAEIDAKNAYLFPDMATAQWNPYFE